MNKEITRKQNLKNHKTTEFSDNMKFQSQETFHCPIQSTLAKTSLLKTHWSCGNSLISTFVIWYKKPKHELEN